ncbi:hypothetical protein [Wenyingzhuangia marina]|uniref:Uncharacterized protein n=1 Tax=Wenyingzhuangia marina TaxID=1195760 RepID=A0A1M5U5E4_9FLAO|nr:hypothetical protein [Wenyingzhuangia marina]GGF69537.1 hypothetical protein GCM10011397_10590 [Wenyingzhuangia marina]SHH58076.1 hypothetical protein SAMN05444281_1038 [Wenyingzhuangia marina]
MKKQNPYLGTLLLIGIVLLFQVEFVRETIDPIREYFPVLWIAVLIWNIYQRVKYKRGGNINQLRIPTNNDDYYKTVPFIFGILLTVGGILALKYLESERILWSLLFMTGILLLILSFLFVPSGIIEIKKNVLSFENGSRKKSIAIERIKNIELKTNEIILNEKNEKKHSVNHMNLTEKTQKSISDLLKSKLRINIEQ